MKMSCAFKNEKIAGNKAFSTEMIQGLPDISAVFLLVQTVVYTTF
jgi:hypothetical protein